MIYYMLDYFKLAPLSTAMAGGGFSNGGARSLRIPTKRALSAGLIKKNE